MFDLFNEGNKLSEIRKKLDKWKTKQKELEALRTEKLKGNLLRSKVKWVGKL
jgi:hypothetical protein